VSTRTLAHGIGAVLLLAAAGGSLVPGSAHAEAAQAGARSLVTVASASGMRMGYSVPDQFAVAQFIDGGGPVAQVAVDSTGKAISFGSLPYPGENAVAAPGVLTLATTAPFPPYPFYVEANYPVTPSEEVQDPSGTYTLSARAEQQAAEGLAAVNWGGPDGPVSRIVSQASGRIDPTGAKVTATSVSEGLTFGDMLRIASVTSRSVTTYAAGAAGPETKSELLIDGASVGGQAVSIGPDGIHPFGQDIAFPGNADQLNRALSQAGISVRTLSLQNGPGEASSEVLQVTVKHPVPGTNVVGTLVYEIGGSTSSIHRGAAGPGLPALPGPEETTPPSSVPPRHPSPVESARPESPPAASSPDLGRRAAGAAGVPPASLSPTGGSAGLGAASRPEEASPAAPTELSGPTGLAAPAEMASEAAVLARPDLKKPGRVLMAVLAAAGAVLLAASTLWRKALS
jgi:hypothetical protein